MEEVESSILSSSTPGVRTDADRAHSSFLGGLVAGEGYFSTGTRRERFADGSPRLRFRFGICMASRDRGLLEELRDLLGCGSIYDRPGAQLHHQPLSTLVVSRSADLRERVIPFAERFLPPGHKHTQFEAWRDRLLAYERGRPTQYGRGPSTCSVDGCDRPVRGRGLCRSHYHRATGH